VLAGVGQSVLGGTVGGKTLSKTIELLVVRPALMKACQAL